MIIRRLKCVEARFKLQLRAEFYNIFTRHALADPVSKPGPGRQTSE